MIATPSSSSTDCSEMKIRLAILKINEADLLREAAEIEKALGAKEAEVIKARRQIDLLTQQIYPSDCTAKETLGRPRRNEMEYVGGGRAEDSLPTLMEKLLGENKDGLSLAELIQKIREKGYVSLSKKPRSMVDQAIFRLRRKGRVVRDPENLKFSLKEGSMNVSN